MRTPIVTLTLIAAVVVSGITGPARAATTVDTTLTFTEGTGAIAITAPVSSTLLPPLSPSGTDQTVSAAIGPVTVTDNQGNDAGWVATASATDFTSGTATITISHATYTTPAATTTGTSTVSATTLGPLSSTPAAVQTATGVSGSNTATWDPTITLTVPAGTVSGTYTSTLTHSVS
jgi:hypothetical protein